MKTLKEKFGELSAKIKASGQPMLPTSFPHLTMKPVYTAETIPLQAVRMLWTQKKTRN